VFVEIGSKILKKESLWIRNKPYFSNKLKVLFCL
jgi:hypothetical protein